jgi:hypothetical protein
MSMIGLHFPRDDKISVRLSPRSWDLIARVLADAPFRVVAPLLAEIQRQCARHSEEAAE